MGHTPPAAMAMIQTTTTIVGKRKREQPPSLVLTICQDKQVDAGWLRSNLRSTTLTVKTVGLSSEASHKLQSLLAGGGATNEWASLEYTLHYADTQLPIEMLQRNRYRDTF